MMRPKVYFKCEQCIYVVISIELYKVQDSSNLFIVCGWNLDVTNPLATNQFPHKTKYL